MYHTINLNVNESRNNKKPTAVDSHFSLDALIKKHDFRIEDFAISNPQIVTYDLVMPQQITVTKADQSVTSAIVFCWHSLLLDSSQQ